MLVVVCVGPGGLASVGHVVRVGCVGGVVRVCGHVGPVSPVISFVLVGSVVLVGRVACIGLFGLVARAAPIAR